MRADWLRSGWAALAGLLFFLAFMVTVLPGQSTAAGEAAGSAGSPDMSFLYSPSDLYSMAEAYGPEGRAAYIRARYTFDIAWPLVYGFFLFTSIGWVFRRIREGSLWMQRARLVPVCAVVLDGLENLSASLVMARYPQTTPLAAAMAPVFTVLKWTLVGGSFGLLLAGLAFGGARWLARRTGPA